MNKTIRRELQVAFSKRSQTPLFRILKYLVLLTLIYFFRKSKWFWIIFGVTVILSFALHFWYRYKTRSWTRSFGGWKYDGVKEEP